VTSASPAVNPPWLSRARVWGTLFLTYTGFLFFLFEYKLARGRAGAFGRRLLEEGTGVYSTYLLLPLVLLFARYYLFECKGSERRGAWHVTGAIVFAFVHTTLMALSRQIMAPLGAARSSLAEARPSQGVCVPAVFGLLPKA
jgi:hypothetical protein